jgi:hypothetical protein
MSDVASNHGPLIEGGGADLLAWWDPGQLAEIARCLQAALSNWARDWIPGGVPASSPYICTFAHERPECSALHWDSIGTRNQAAAWVEVRDDPVVHIQQAIFGAEHHSPAPTRQQGGIAHAVANRAWAALADSLCDCLSLDSDHRQAHADRALFKPWSGGVVASSSSVGPLFHSVLLNAECVRALLRSHASHMTPPARARQVPIRVTVEEALADHKLPIQVQLAGCELDLGILQSLRVGDIVPLPHHLDAPLLVSTPAYGTFCAGFLGRQAGWKAIELLRQPSASDCETLSDHYQEQKHEP